MRRALSQSDHAVRRVRGGIGYRHGQGRPDRGADGAVLSQGGLGSVNLHSHNPNIVVNTREQNALQRCLQVRPPRLKVG